MCHSVKTTEFLDNKLYFTPKKTGLYFILHIVYLNSYSIVYKYMYIHNITYYVCYNNDSEPINNQNALAKE